MALNKEWVWAGVLFKGLVKLSGHLITYASLERGRVKTKLLNMREGEMFACVYTLRSSHRRCSTKKGFLKISQILQENTYAEVSF